MTILVLGLVLFIGAHVFVTLRDARAALIARIGEWPYKGAMSLVSLVGLIMIGYGFGQYRATGWVEVWHPPHWTYYITQILMWPASICVVAAYSRGNIWRRLKHPMLVGVKPLPWRTSLRTAISARSCCSARSTWRSTTGSRSSAAAILARRRSRLAASAMTRSRS
jgi:hypothetical protein